MPSIRPEFIQATEDNLPNPFLQPQWPDDIPQQCPCCHEQLHPKIHLSYGSGKIGRCCKTLSHWISLPWFPIALLFSGPLFSSGNGGGFALGVLFILPAVCFAVLGRLAGRSRRVQCFPCKYSKDYPATH